MREFIKRQIMPPLLLKAWGHLRGVRPDPFYGLAGDFPSFEAAQPEGLGYETGAVAARAAESLRALISAPPYTALDERFLQVHSALAYVAQLEVRDSLSVLDFGGGSGVYAKVMRQLMPATNLEWTVLESAPVAEACNAAPNAFAKFASDAAGQAYDVAIISGALQYLREPWAALERTLGQSRWTVLTRLPLIGGDDDRVTLQVSPPHLRPPASVPLWLFSEKKVRAFLGSRIKHEWHVAADAGAFAPVNATPMGFLIRS